MLELPDSWVWDSWIVDTGHEFHLFFLFASRALDDPERRHRRASVGHAVSTDLVEWRRLADALVRSDAPAIDDVATWTGSCVRGDDGRWRMFFTGLSDEPVRGTQVVTSAWSDDLLVWHKAERVDARADPRWYATGTATGIEDFRDPWVMPGDDGRWHMLVAASDPEPSSTGRGVIGHAVSDDLSSWEVTEPVVARGTGFDELEVPSVVDVDGETLLVFCCLAGRMSPRRRAQSPTGGLWFAPAAGPAGPFDLDRVLPLTTAELYAGHIVTDRQGTAVLLAFENIVDGRFVGRIADPVPVGPLVAAARARAEGDSAAAEH